MSRDIPIIFSAPMVRALLAGRKTMTRRLRLQKHKSAPHVEAYDHYFIDSPWVTVKAGDRLWVRENFAHVGANDPGYLVYQATYPEDLPAGIENVPANIREAGCRWRPSIHMARAFSRLTLTVTATKIERLQDITENDARCEGVPRGYFDDDAKFIEDERERGPGTFRNGFAGLWCRLHKDHMAWATNPEVVALTFTVSAQNIDHRSEAA